MVIIMTEWGFPEQLTMNRQVKPDSVHVAEHTTFLSRSRSITTLPNTGSLFIYQLVRGYSDTH